MRRDDWRDAPDSVHTVRVSFVDNEPDAWLTVEDALDRINPIDRDLARSALLDGGTFRTFGAWYRYDPQAES